MMKKLLRIAMALIALGITLGVLGFSYLNWRGARVWAAERERLVALGEPMTPAEIEGEPIPDELNFAAAPIIAETFEKPRDEMRLSKLHRFVGGFQREFSHMVNAARAVQPGFRGDDPEAARIIVAAVEAQREIWGEVRAAAERPGTRWPLDFSNGFPNNLGLVTTSLSLGQSLNRQALAHLELGESDAALENLLLLWDIADRNRAAPILIAHLVRISLVVMGLGVVSDGIERGAWDDGKLQRIGRELGGIDLNADLQQSLRGERVIVNQVLERVRKEGFGVLTETYPDESMGAALGWFDYLPRGLVLNDTAYIAGLYQVIIEAMDDPQRAPGVIEAVDLGVEEVRANPFKRMITPLSTLAGESIAGAARRTLYFQSQVEMAVVACAIERFRLPEGRVPEELLELVPDFLAEEPVDLMAGEALRYRAEERGDFSLYSVGWDRDDDGGSSERPSRRAFLQSADWLWGDW